MSLLGILTDWRRRLSHTTVPVSVHGQHLLRLDAMISEAQNWIKYYQRNIQQAETKVRCLAGCPEMARDYRAALEQIKREQRSELAVTQSLATLIYVREQLGKIAP